MSKNKKETNATNVCPKCNHLINAKDTYCTSCGYVINKNIKTVHLLRFGSKKTEEVEAKENSIFYPSSTKGINFAKKIYNILFVLLGVFAVYLLFLPLFPSNNVYKQYVDVSSYYHYVVNDTLMFDNKSNLLDLINNIVGYLQIDASIANSSMLIFIYEIIVSLITITMIILGVILFVMALIGFINKGFLHKIKKVNGVLFALSLIMIFVFNCYSVTYILIASMCLIAYIILYIGEIITKEKTLYLKPVILKSIAIALILIVLITSSFYLIDFNITLGANLYRYENISNDASNTMPTLGFFLDVIQSVQCSSGDDAFVRMTTYINYLKMIMHISFEVIIIISLISLIKSFPSQATKFPLARILISTVLFYGFIISLSFFNQIVNDASFNQYVEQVGIKEFSTLCEIEKLNIEKANRIFTYKWGYYVSMCLYLPMCIYSFIANRICYEKTYY